MTGGHLLPNLLLFARALRTAGVPVRAGGAADAARALDGIGIARRSDVREAMRTVLLSRHEDFAIFDELFDRFWRVWAGPPPAGMPRPMQPPRRARASLKMLIPAAAGEAQQPAAPAADEAGVGVRTYSAE